MTELWGCLVVAQLAVQAGVRTRPALARQAVVVMAGVRPTERVCSVNVAARQAGLCEGMTRVEVETFDDVSILAQSAAEEASATRILTEAMARFSPRVEARRSGADWECVVDLSGTERLLGTPFSIGCQIVSSLENLGFTAFCCIASNADAGLSVARFGAWCRPDPEQSSGTPPASPDAPKSSRLHATRVASSVRVMEAGKEAWALSSLPVAVLRLDGEMCERFSLWGIRTLGELAALPETALIVRIGQPGKTLRQRARGQLPHLLQPAEEPFRLEEVLPLEEPIDTLEPLLFLIDSMLELLLERVTARALALASITVTFNLEIPADRLLGTDDPTSRQPATISKHLPQPTTNLVILTLSTPKGNDSWSSPSLTVPGAPCLASQTWEFSRTIQPAIPTTDRALLLKMLQLDLEAHPAPGAVTTIRLTGQPGATSRIQLGLFAPQMPEPTRFEDTHARLVALLGESSVGRVRLLDTHAPESFLLERFTLPSGEFKPAAPRPEATPPATALRRLQPALHVRVSIKANEILGFWLETRRFEVLRCFGPWRSSGAWWAGNGWSQDTWDLATRCEADGEILLCLLAHDITRDAWLLEGVYD